MGGVNLVIKLMIMIGSIIKEIVKIISIIVKQRKYVLKKKKIQIAII